MMFLLHIYNHYKYCFALLLLCNYSFAINDLPKDKPTKISAILINNQTEFQTQNNSSDFNWDAVYQKQATINSYAFYSVLKREDTGICNPPGPEYIVRNIACDDTVSIPGTYIQSYSYPSSTQNQCSGTRTVVILPKVQVNFSYSISTTCTGSATATFTGDITGVNCDFGLISQSHFNNDTSNLSAGNHYFNLTYTAPDGRTCSEQKQFSIINTVANFGNTIPCIGFATTFTNTSIIQPTGTLTSVWDFGDGSSTNTNNNPNHTYTNGGTYSVTLNINDGFCNSAITKTITVIAPGSISVTTPTICPGSPATFTASGANAYTWLPGNVLNNATGNIVSGNPISQLTVTGTDANGCIINTVTAINFLPVPTITVNNPDLCLGKTATVTAFGALSYTWFPIVSNSAVITDNPISTSIYTIVGTGLTCTAQATSTITVYTSPTIAFISDTVCLTNGTTLTDTSNGNGFPITYHGWDFDNNGIADDIGSTITSNVFLNYGNTAVAYSISTTPTIGLTCSASTVQNVWVNPLPQPAFVFTNNCINAQPNVFDASASTIAIGTNTNYAWDFGDTQTTNSLTATTSHSYSAVSIYTVVLTVTSNKGCIKNSSLQTEVYPKPIMSVSASSLICLGSIMSFTAHELANSGQVISWLWDVNNSITSIETSGKQSGFTFLTAGTQTIALVTITDHACRDTMKRMVYINYNPVPNFTIDDPDGCPLPHCVEFTDQTATITPPSQVVTWDWDFGNGSSNSVITNVSQNSCYTNTSSNLLALFTVTLTTKTDSSCVTSHIKNNLITVYPKPIAIYTVTPDLGTVVVPQIHFTNQSIDYTKWYWTFGDGDKLDSININPSHYYNSNNADSYFSNLIVANQYGCTDTAYVEVVIKPDFVFYIPNAFSPNEDGINEGFTGKGIGILKYDMWIYDRWGEQIYYTDDINKAWDGKKLGAEEDCKQDIYTWKVELKDVFNKKHNYVGHVTLLR